MKIETSAALPARFVRALCTGIALAWCLLQSIPIIRGPYEYEVMFLAGHVGAALALAYLSFGAAGARKEDAPVPVHDVMLSLASIASAFYFATQGQRIAERIEGVDPVLVGDYVAGILLLVLLLEACRRTAGLVLTLVAVAFIIYVFAGPYLPSLFEHRGMSLKRFMDLQVLSTSGVFGTPISASAHMVFYFVVVGAFLERSGAGQLFVSIAYSITARAWGGAGKAAVLSSGLFGTVSGSAVANVLLSGLMTIPLMKRSGFRPTFAGALEATASTGGQLAPPIMGAAAFVLADVVGVSYGHVALAAVVPALLYYASLFMLVHAYSLRHGLVPDRTQSISKHLAGLKQRWHLLVPMAFMVWMLVAQFSLMTVGVYTTGLIIGISFLRRATRLNLTGVVQAARNGTHAAAQVAIPSAVAGIVVGTLVQTGLALRLQSWLLGMAGDSLAISLAGAMFLTIIFGMGMPTTAAYLISAILVAPALQELGIPALAAHLFILYFGILSMVTPPVALSAYAAAGISGASMWWTGVQAFLLSAPGFIIPYAFAMNPALILQGDAAESVRVILTASTGVIMMAAASGGYLFGPMSMVLRILLFCASPLLIAPGNRTDILGALVVAAIAAFQFWWFRHRQGRPKPADRAQVGGADRARE